MAHKDESTEERTGLDRLRADDKSLGRKARAKRSKAGRRGRAFGAGRKPGGKKMNADVRRWVSTLVLLVVVCAVAVVGFTPVGDKITQGLDIRGGVSVIMTATTKDGSQPTAANMDTATAIIQSRVNSLGASEATVQKQGDNSILIQIPGATDAEAAVETIGKTGYLEFVRLDAIGDADALAQLNAGKTDVALKEGTYEAFMDGSSISDVSIAQSQTGSYAVNLKLNSEGTSKFAEVTQELAATQGRIAIVLDGVVKSSPSVQSAITNGEVSITGNFTIDTAKDLETVLDSGSLPVTLNYSESRVVGPTLGQDSLHQGMLAIFGGMAIVIVYLFVFYRGMGLLTMGSLGVFAVIYLGILAGLSHYGMFSLSLAGIAGMVLTIGMAADSSILVLERFREEIRMGRSVRSASLSGVKHGIGTSVDADMVTLVSAAALFFFSVGQVKGFGLTLGLGILCDLITMFAFKAPALRLLARGTIQKHPGFWGVSEDLAEAATLSGVAAKGVERNA